MSAHGGSIASMNMKTILFTVDLEDWFQVENFKKVIPSSRWDNLEWRFEYNTRTLLELFCKKGIKTTFFILGWNAKRLPSLVKEIADLGHEIASHGYGHELCPALGRNALREDLMKSGNILEDITGRRVRGYRAPSFSVTNELIILLKELGFEYDSSYNSFGLNGRYGSISLQNYRRNGIACVDPDGFVEFPISNINIGGVVLPWGGGGYFRLIYPGMFNSGVRRIIRENNGYIFYIHPWEIDFDQPKVGEADFFFKFRHYINLESCLMRVERFVDTFKDFKFLTCSEYVKHLPASSIRNSTH